MQMQQIVHMLSGISGVIGAHVEMPGVVEGSSDPTGLPPHQWQRSLLLTAISDVAAVSGHGVDENVRVESNGFVVIAQSWEGYRISIIAKMGTPHTKSLARAIRRVRAKVEQPAKVVADTAVKSLDIRPDNA